MKLWEAFKAVSENYKVEYRSREDKSSPWRDFQEPFGWCPKSDYSNFEFRLKSEKAEKPRLTDFDFQCTWQKWDGNYYPLTMDLEIRQKLYQLWRDNKITRVRIEVL